VDETVRWGILGTGKIAGIVARAVDESRDGELVAVGSRDLDRARAFAASFSVPRHSGYEDVVQDADVEIVYVANHHPLHRQWAVAAANRGKHILCEKPLAVTHADAVQIVAAARENDVFLLEAFAYRCHPQTATLVELVRSGRIGEIRMIDAVFGYDAGPEPANYLMVHELGGGSILDVGCYATSMAHLVVAAGADANAVPALDVAAEGVVGPSGVDHASAATLLFPRGVLARVACSIQANLDSSVRIYGSDGRIELPSPWLPGRIDGDARIIVQEGKADSEVIDLAVEADVYTIEVETVNALVRGGQRSTPLMAWEDSLANMHTLDRWRWGIGLRYEGEA
jgi:predicted dehydrogenase